MNAIIIEIILVEMKSHKFNKKNFFRNYLKWYVGALKAEKKIPLTINAIELFDLQTGERPFKCSTCDMTFAQGNALKCHKRIHVNISMWVCSEFNCIIVLSYNCIGYHFYFFFFLAPDILDRRKTIQVSNMRQMFHAKFYSDYSYDAAYGKND